MSFKTGATKKVPETLQLGQDINACTVLVAHEDAAECMSEAKLDAGHAGEQRRSFEPFVIRNIRHCCRGGQHTAGLVRGKTHDCLR